MTDNRIRSLVNSFKDKIRKAQREDQFDGTILAEFPKQCCGVASTLLAEYLQHNGVETLWVSAKEPGTYETHAWLVVKDDRIELPRSCFNGVPNDIIGWLGKYGGGCSEKIRNATCYEENDIQNGLIIDITGEQFGEAPVYVDNMDDFHKQFDFVAAYEYGGLPNEEYAELYDIIISQ